VQYGGYWNLENLFFFVFIINGLQNIQLFQMVKLDIM